MKNEHFELIDSIKFNGFTEHTLQLINNLVNDIYNGNINVDRFDTSEHAGFCSAGKVLIGAEIIASYTRAGLRASGNAGESQTTLSN